MRVAARVLLFCLVAPGAVVLAQEKPATTATAATEPNPFSAYNKTLYGRFQGILLKSADRMPEENYSFKPTESVRSFGQMLGHVADAQYMFCSNVLGEKNPAPKIEQTKTSKADLAAALKDAFAYCDKAYDSMTDATAAQTVKLFGNDMPKLGVLTVNTLHNVEHYGNMVTYMRMKGIVPPTSDPPPQAQKKPEEKK